MKNILVVGGFGFLGSTLVGHLLNTNKYQITILVKKSSNTSRIDDNLIEKIKVTYIEDLNFNGFFEENKFYSIINAAVVYDNKFSYKVFETNFLLTLKIIEYGRINACNNFIIFDSFYRKFKTYDQKNYYRLSKEWLAVYLESFKKERVVNLQLEHMYGPYDNESKFIPKIISALLEGNKEISLTEGNQKRDFIFVEDVCDLTLEILEKVTSFNQGISTIEVGTGEAIKLKEFVNKIKYIFKNDTTSLEFGAHPENTTEIQISKANLDLMPTFLSWRPKTTVNEGINKILQTIKH